MMNVERRESVFICNIVLNDIEFGKERRFCICNILNDIKFGKERNVCICNIVLNELSCR